MQLWRYVNGIPLLDFGDDALSCALSAAIKSVKWTKFGHSLRVDTLANLSKVGTDNNILLSTPSWLLVPKRVDFESFAYTSHASANLKTSPNDPSPSVQNAPNYLRAEDTYGTETGVFDIDCNHIENQKSKKNFAADSDRKHYHIENRESKLFNSHGGNVMTSNKSRNCSEDVASKMVSRYHNKDEKIVHGSDDIGDQTRSIVAKRTPSIYSNIHEHNPSCNIREENTSVCQPLEKRRSFGSKENGSKIGTKVLPCQMIILLDVRTMAGNHIALL